MAESSRAREIIQAAITGSLGTITDDGKPFVSFVTVAAQSPTRIGLLLSGLARHTRNLSRRPDCSLMLINRDNGKGDPLSGARLTLAGVVRRLDSDDVPAMRTIFLERHPKAALYVDFDDFSFYRLDVDEAHLVAGFGRITEIAGNDL